MAYSYRERLVTGNALGSWKRACWQPAARAIPQPQNAREPRTPPATVYQVHPPLEVA